MRIYLLLIFSIVIISCGTNDKPSLEKVWFYNDNLSQEEQVSNVHKYGSTSEYGFTGASFLNLRADGKFTSFFSSFDYGEWKLKDSTLLLTTHNKGKLSLDIKALNKNQMLCINKSNQKIYPFNGFNDEVSSDAESPFSIGNNLWRVKAKHKESDAELRTRLKNHFRWWEKYFSWAIVNKMEELDIKSTASVLDLYGNGFELKYYDYQFPEWKNIFYDTSNCWRAYEIVYYLMYKKNIDWPETKNRFEGFVSAFKQLQQWMDIDTKTYLPAKDSDDVRTATKKVAGKVQDE